MENTRAGLGYAEVLTLIFIVLKVLGYVNWSWLWVFAPLWISLLFWAGLLLLIFIVGAVSVGIGSLLDKRRKR